MTERATIAVTREGNGPEVLFVHGGAGPRATWRGLEGLSARWTLAFAHRRGFPPSPPPPRGRQDFEIDAHDLAPLLDARPHIVAHSYGALGSLIAAARRPGLVRSLTLIEPALFLPADDPEVVRFRRMGEECLAHGLDAEPETLREFLKIAGVSSVADNRPLPEEVARGVRRALGGRPPSEAEPPLEELRDAGVPALVVSGDHHPAVERMCDATASALNAQRLIAPGAGHFVAAAPGFAEQLERFLAAPRPTAQGPPTSRSSR
ncbi:MAG TPA: alpha/beta hydrolase [Solirubrobacteraceae bacterium]|jgi:pimeloyl-ACP methyl ester carboxylesterase